MAGIGFQLKRSLSDESYSGLIKGYLFASVIAAGPWIFSILSINLMSLFIQKFFSFEFFEFFNTLITYSFCFSLILFGLMDHVITRYLSDLLYFQEKALITSSFCTIWLFLLLLLSLFALPFYYFCHIDPFFKVTGFTFFLSLGSIWLSMIFLSAARHYFPIVLAFILGGIISYASGRYLGQTFGIKGIFLGYLLGQISILFILLFRIYREFSFKPIFSFEWMSYFKKFPLLILAGFFLNLSLWIDKIIFWFSAEDGKQVASLFYNDVHYGSTLFISYLTMIPVLTIFLVQIETSFYVYYRKFFGAIDTKKGLKEILQRKEEMVQSLRKNIGPMLTVQGFITGLMIVLAPKILSTLHLPSTTLAIFRTSLLGVFLQSMIIIMGILLLYLLEYKKVIVVYASYFLINFLLTQVTLKLGFPFWGFGFMLSSLIIFVVMYALLNRQIGLLEFKTFFGQPLVAPKMYKTQVWEPTETLLTPKEILEEKEEEIA